MADFKIVYKVSRVSSLAAAFGKGVKLAVDGDTCLLKLMSAFTLGGLSLAKTCGTEIGSRSPLIVVAHVFSWPPVRLVA